MITHDLPVAFRHAKVTGKYVNPELHHVQEVQRGHRDFVMSRGELVRFNECPAKWIQNAEADEESSFMAWGDLIDCLLLVPEQFQDRFAVCPETYPDKKTGDPKPWNFNADFCKSWRAEQDGKTVIKSDTYSEAQNALDKLRRNDEVTAVLAGAKTQVAVHGEYVDAATELMIPIRGLIDIVPTGEFTNALVDLKTTRSAESDTWARKVDADGLDAQAAFYLDLWAAATGEPRSEFRHIIQESKPPYHVELRLVSEEFIEVGRLKYRSALKKYCQCLKSNEWPGYPSRQRFGLWSLTEPSPYMVARL